MVLADFEDLSNSGDACLDLAEIRRKLMQGLGHGEHFHFVNMCRNPIRDGIDPAGTGLFFKKAETGIAAVHMLYSVRQGAGAMTWSDFGRHLLAGLDGAGSAKGWDGQEMWVIFDRLHRYVFDKVGLKGDPTSIGNGPGRILKVEPVPPLDCTVTVDNADPSDQFLLELSLNKIPLHEHRFSGPAPVVLPTRLPQHDYTISVTHEGGEKLDRVKPPDGEPVAFYERCEVHYELQRVPAGELEFSIPGDGWNAREGYENGAETIERISPAVPAARAIESRSNVLTAHSGSFLDVTWRKQRRETKLKSIFGDPATWTSGFGEVLGKGGDEWAPAYWLAVIGASRITGLTDGNETLRTVSLESFNDVARDDAPIYVLAAFDEMPAPYRIGLGQGGNVAWTSLEESPGVVGIHEYWAPSRPGPKLLSFQAGDLPPVTFATYGLPNRATFATLTESSDGRLRLHQYLFPIHKLIQFLPEAVRDHLAWYHSLHASMRTIYLAQRLFARGRPTAQADREAWHALIYGKWLDPIMSLIAAYDLIRHGGVRENRALLETMINNLRLHFQGLPDIEAIALLLERADATRPQSPPLLLDGFSCYDAEQEEAFPPSHLLDYTTPWTTWRNAVTPLAKVADNMEITTAPEPEPGKEIGSEDDSWMWAATAQDDFVPDRDDDAHDDSDQYYLGAAAAADEPDSSGAGPIEGGGIVHQDRGDDGAVGPGGSGH